VSKTLTRLAVLPWLLAALHAAASEPDHVRLIQRQLQKVDQALQRPEAGLVDSDLKLLREKKAEADVSLQRYSALLAQGEHYESAVLSLAAVNTGLVADDATVVGAVDDFLLPFTGLALVMTAMIMTKPASAATVNTAWQDLIHKLQALSLAATQAASRRTCNCLCLKRGVGPSPIPEARTEAKCIEKCGNPQYNGNGYRCGNGVVKWFN